MNTILRFARRISISCLLFCLFLWLIQDFLLFPRLQEKFYPFKKAALPPENVESFMIETPDGAHLNVWTTYGKTPGLNSPYVGIIFHGNGETVANMNYLPFFARHHIPAFTFDYRGYGTSTGWMSERHLLDDSETVWQAVQKKTGVRSSQVVVLGNSIGAGPASYLASKISPRALILIAGYTSVQEILNDLPIYRPFSWLLRYQLRTVDYLAKLKTHCGIMAHGKQDTVINFRHLGLLKASINPHNLDQLIILEDQQAAHNDIYYKIEERLDRALNNCLADGGHA